MTVDKTRQDGAGPLLRVEHLDVEFHGERGSVKVLSDVSFTVNRAEIVAVVGESGSGKSVTALSVMRLLPAAGRVTQGSIQFDGQDLLTLDADAIRDIRGGKIAMIFQDPMTALNPVLTIGFQLTESIKVHLGMNAADARAKAIELMKLVGITEPESRFDQYPHQFSGGMRQRVMIAIGLSCGPKLLIADEPTTALDVTIQAQILELMRDLTQRLGVSLIIITHNLGVVARYADRILVMYAGKMVEHGVADAVFYQPRHLYTAGLIASVPRLDGPARSRLDAIEGLPPDLSKLKPGCRFAVRCPHVVVACDGDTPLVETDIGSYSACVRAKEMASGNLQWPNSTAKVSVLSDLRKDRQAQNAGPLVSVQGLKRHYAMSGGWGKPARTVRAVDGVSFTINPGETLGLVGESGCGKSTIGRMLLRLENPTEGGIHFNGQDITRVGHRELTGLRRHMQVVFQDPYASLNPRKRVGDTIAESLRVHRITSGAAETRDRVAQLLTHVGLRPDMHDRYPHQISGGQRQRIGIARALAVEPSFIVCDEAVSALDVSIQAQIVNVLADLQQEYRLAYLFIAHDLAVVRHISTHVMVMYLGKAVEVADRDSLYAAPLHPYTQILIDAAPTPDPRRERARQPSLIRGEPPSPFNPPTGCAFRTRCPSAIADCATVVPELREVRPGHRVACIRVG